MKSLTLPRFWNRIASLILTGSFISSVCFCFPLNAAQVPTTLPPFAADWQKFAAIAKPYIPVEVFNRGYFESGLAGSTVENYVIVTFKISSTVTRQELGWLDGPDTKFTNTGYLPQDTFNELNFKIDVATENLILKEALDRAPIQPIINGTITIRQSSPCTWPTVAAAAVLIGGMFALWLGLRRDKGNHEN